MIKLKNKKSMEVYELLENQMTFLAALFGGLAIICTLLAFNFNKKKGIAASREISWTDVHKDETAIRFQFSTKNKDLGFVYATLHITKVTNHRDSVFGSFNILAKEAELYLKEGLYKAEIETREFQNKVIEIAITSEDIQKRKWFDVYLEKKHN
jgi:hypothetical protein